MIGLGAEICALKVNRDLSQSDLDIIEASYRLVADSTAFDDIIATWVDRIDRVDDHQIARLDHPLIVRHLNAVTKLFDQVVPADRDPVAQATVGVNGPAAVLAPDGTVVAVNEAAYESWNLQLHETADISWVDPNSLSSFDAVRRSASRRGSHRHAVLRTSDNSAGSRLAECFIIEPYDGKDSLIAVRALDLRWNKDVANTLSEAFGLTGAEVEICHLLLDTRDTAQIAELRASSVHTVRTQLRAIFAKTETLTQVDLIRLIAMLCSRSSETEFDGSTRWIDPLGHETVFADSDHRKIAFSWVGDPDGRPALLCHGMATGYLLPPDARDALLAYGIKLYLISRPGFGNSDPAPHADPIQAAANAITALAEYLNIDSWPAIGHSAGLPPLVCAAADRRSRLSALVGAAAYLPYPADEKFEAFPPARKIAFRLARNSQLMADLVGRFCFRMMQSKNNAFLKDYMYSDCDADRLAVQDPACVEIIDKARQFMMTHRHQAIAGDLRIMAMDWSDKLRNCPVPLNLLHGENDPVNRIAFVRSRAASHQQIDLTVIPRCGELLFCNHSRKMIETLAESFPG